MSALLDRPVTRTSSTLVDVPVILHPRTPVEPVRQPVIEVPISTPSQAPAKSKSGVGIRIARFVVTKTFLFGLVFASTYVGSTLSGQFLVEQSRTQGIDAQKRSETAIAEERAIQLRLDSLRRAAAIEEWALSHGFRPADGLGQTSKA
ncbi:MAG: hypothetical protein P4L46_04395 [Fimbriimonas sp.]|nr:hypothetical protein [Fimbriimonas sp.]